MKRQVLLAANVRVKHCLAAATGVFSSPAYAFRDKARAEAGLAQTVSTAIESTNAPTDAELVIAARAGENWAREMLCRRHMRLVLGLSQRVLMNLEEADDVVQDAFVEALQRLDTLRNPQAFAAWLCSIVVRRAGKHLRHARLLARLGLRARTQIDPNTLIASNAPADVVHELRTVYSVLASLPARDAIVLVLRRIDGLEHLEIAEHMQLSLATVKRRLAAAEARLERALKKQGSK